MEDTVSSHLELKNIAPQVFVNGHIQAIKTVEQTGLNVTKLQ